MTTAERPIRSDPKLDDAMARSLEMGEVGIQICAYLDGDLVVDTCAGTMSRGGPLVSLDTLFPIYSVSKAATALALHLQAERGLVDVEAPICTYWPEFAANAKDSITVRDVLSHRSGFPQLPAEITPETIIDWDWVVGRLAEMSPLCLPDTRNTYQALNFGWLIGEVVRRTDPDHRSIGRFIREELAGPLDAHDLYIGLPAAEIPRLAPGILDVEPPEPTAIREAAVPRAVAIVPRIWNNERFYTAELAAAGGVASARSVARLFAMVANGGVFAGKRYLSQSRVESFLVPRHDALRPDDTIGEFIYVGQGGLWLGETEPKYNHVVGIGDRIAYHAGSGGSIGWADVATGLSVSILHNRRYDGPWALDTHPFGEIAEVVRSIAYA